MTRVIVPFTVEVRVGVAPGVVALVHKSGDDPALWKAPQEQFEAALTRAVAAERTSGASAAEPSVPSP